MLFFRNSLRGEEHQYIEWNWETLGFKEVFVTDSIGVEILTKDKIDKLCNADLVNGTYVILDNTTRNSFGPYTDGSVVCSKSKIPEYDFILNLKELENLEKK